MAAQTRILIVDDDRSMTRTLADIFRVKGYTTEVAHSGSEALAILSETSFDCVLTDVTSTALSCTGKSKPDNPDFPWY